MDFNAWDTRNLGPIGKRLRIARGFRDLQRDLQVWSDRADQELDRDSLTHEVSHGFNRRFELMREMPKALVSREMGLRSTLRLRDLGRQFA